MKPQSLISTICILALFLMPAIIQSAQNPPANQNPSASPNPPVSPNPSASPNPPATPNPAALQQPIPGLTTEAIINRAIEREKQLANRLKEFRPMMETYVQHLALDEALGTKPDSDKYFLGKLDLTGSISQKSLMPTEGLLSKLRNSVTMFYSVHYVPDGFAQMILVDDLAFEYSNYDFEYKRKEFLGEVRTLVFDVQPKPDSKVARFRGTIWIEDQDFSIVRFNGNFGRSKGTKMYFHFDSWRENLVEDLWLPAYIYTEESDLGYFLGTRKLRFKGQTRLWGYTTGRPDMQGEMTTLKVDQVVDTVDSTHNMSPVSNSRMWQRQAEDNTLNRMEKAGLIAPIGEVEKVLETVITNIEVTNNLQIEPGVRARVMLTSPLESYTVGQTIVLSRGLIDVLPDEASLAMVLAHELAHISLGHRIDTKYSFGDRMLFKDEETFHRLVLKRNPKEEVAADKRAAELLNNSPYRDKLGNAGLFLRAVGYGAPHLTSLLRPHMGNYIVEDSKVRRMAELMNGAPQLEPANIEQIAALPLGGRIRLNPWTSRIELIKSPPVPVVYAHEKMPFEVSPIYLNLTRLKATTN